MNIFLFVCPECHNSLECSPHGHRCASCNIIYPVSENIPIFVRDATDVKTGAGAVGDVVYERIPIAAIDDNNPLFLQDIVRYRFACRYAKDKRVLDVACGTGYGTRMLAEEGGAKLVVGADLSWDGLVTGRREASNFDIQFICASVNQLPLPDASIDLVVSMETIEHLPEPDKYLSELRRVLAPDGLVIISTPLNESASRISPANPYHVREYSASEFKLSLNSFFNCCEFFSQTTDFKDDLFDKPGFRSKPVDLVRSIARNILPVRLRKIFRRTVGSKGRQPFQSAIVDGVDLSASVQLGVCTNE